jgi:hypothetical protein
MCRARKSCVPHSLRQMLGSPASSIFCEAHTETFETRNTDTPRRTKLKDGYWPANMVQLTRVSKES